MKKHYINPSIKEITVAPFLMQLASNQRSITVNGTVEATSGFADGKETEISSGSIWGEEE